jgi:hypothetical protein
MKQVLKVWLNIGLYSLTMLSLSSAVLCSEGSTINDPHMILTEHAINQLKTDTGCFSAAVMKMLCEEYPPKKGWTYNLRGKEITQEQYDLMRAKRNDTRNPNRRDKTLDLFA